MNVRAARIRALGAERSGAGASPKFPRRIAVSSLFLTTQLAIH